jgi:WD40 repeat protein
MKLGMVRLKVIPIIFILLNSLSLCASSLIYKSSVVTQDTNYPLHSGDIVQGFVRLNDGFCVSPAATGIMDCYMSVSGGFSLNDSGKLMLLKDLEFEHAVTLTSHGDINGCGNSLIFNDRFLLANNKILHISGNTIIDGRSNVLSVGSGAQIFVDTGVTLTLRNLTLRNGNRTPTFPPIRLASHGSKLALDNVILAPTGDFNFSQGQLFIHNDVMVTGSSTFAYQSTQPSIITSNGHLIFDCGTSFSFCPSTTGDHILAAKDLLRFQDQSSTLMMNGADLLISWSGLRVTKGTLLFDNAVTLKTDWGRIIDNNPTHYSVNQNAYPGTSSLGSSVNAVAWSPDGRYVVVGSSNLVQAYRFTGGSNGGLTAIGSSIGLGSTVYSVAWSPDGRFVAVGCNASSNQLRLLKFVDEVTGLAVYSGSGESIGYDVKSVSWSSDSRYVVVGDAFGYLTVYKLTFASASAFTFVSRSSQFGSGQVQAIQWSSQGTYIIAGTGFNLLRVYEFVNGVISQVGSGQQSMSGQIMGVSWSPNGKYAAAIDNNGSAKVYRFVNGGTTGGLAEIASGSTSIGTAAGGVSWSYDGTLLAIAGGRWNGSSTVGRIQLYYFSGQGSNGGLATVDSGVVEDGVGSSSKTVCAWSPDGRNVFAGDWTGKFKVYAPNFMHTLYSTFTIPSEAVYLSRYSEGLILGNKSLGINFDCTMRLLSGAQINLSGHVIDDCM